MMIMFIVALVGRLIYVLAMNFLKMIIDIMYDSVVTAGSVCSDGRLIKVFMMTGR